MAVQLPRNSSCSIFYFPINIIIFVSGSPPARIAEIGIATIASTTIAAIGTTGIATRVAAVEPTMAIATTSTTRMVAAATAAAAAEEEAPPTTAIATIRAGIMIETGIATTDSMGVISCWVVRSWHRGSSAT